MVIWEVTNIGTEAFDHKYLQRAVQSHVRLLGGDIEGHVVIMHFLHEFTEDHQKVFEGKNPGITTEVIQADLNRFYAMTAAGAPPDLLRLQAPSIPQYLARGLLYDLTPFFEVSEVLSLEDLAEANDYYKANSPLAVGEGPIYGMCKDFSPDFTVWVYDQAFEDADLTPPSDSAPMTYQEVAEYAKAVAKFEGDRTLMFGFDFEWSWVDRIMENMLQETGISLYDAGMGSMNLANNEAAVEVAQYIFNLAKDKLSGPAGAGAAEQGDLVLAEPLLEVARRCQGRETALGAGPDRRLDGADCILHAGPHDEGVAAGCLVAYPAPQQVPVVVGVEGVRHSPLGDGQVASGHKPVVGNVLQAVQPAPPVRDQIGVTLGGQTTPPQLIAPM